MENSFNLQQPQPQQQDLTQPSPEEISGGHKAIEATMEGLIKLVSRPKGDLSRKDVFDGVSGIIANGGFPSPESKQQLITGLAKLPSDENEIRETLGQYLMHIAMFRDHYHNAFGPPQQQEGGMNDAI